jgi:hypothetical protein
MRRGLDLRFLRLLLQGVPKCQDGFLRDHSPGICMNINIHSDATRTDTLLRPIHDRRNRNAKSPSGCGELVIDLAFGIELSIFIEMVSLANAGDAADAVLLSRPEFQLRMLRFHPRKLAAFHGRVKARNTGGWIWNLASGKNNRHCRFPLQPSEALRLGTH